MYRGARYLSFFRDGCILFPVFIFVETFSDGTLLLSKRVICFSNLQLHLTGIPVCLYHDLGPRA
jgi:hypothetical protein